MAKSQRILFIPNCHTFEITFLQSIGETFYVTCIVCNQRKMYTVPNWNYNYTSFFFFEEKHTHTHTLWPPPSKQKESNLCLNFEIITHFVFFFLSFLFLSRHLLILYNDHRFDGENKCRVSKWQKALELHWHFFV